MGGGDGDVRRGCSSVAQQVRREDVLYCRTSSCKNESKAHREQKQQRVQRERESKEYSEWTSALKISIAKSAEREREDLEYCCSSCNNESKAHKDEGKNRRYNMWLHAARALWCTSHHITNRHFTHTQTHTNERKWAQSGQRSGKRSAKWRKSAQSGPVSWQIWLC